MKKNNLLFWCTIIIFIGVVIFNFTRFFWDDDYFGEGGSDTPVNALIEASKDGPWADELVVKERIDAYDFDDMIEYLFINQYDDLCVAGVYLDNNGKWTCLTSSVENDLNDPHSFILDGNFNQEINAKYHAYDGIVYGWKLSSAPDILINEQKVNTKTYKIKIDGKDWSIDYWWIDVVNLSEDGLVASFKYSE